MSASNGLHPISQGNGTGSFKAKVNEVKRHERKKCEDFDEILELIGSDGKYQKILLYAVICPFVFVSPFLYMTKLFMLDVPNHWCHVHGRNESISVEDWKNRTLPWETSSDGTLGHSQCSMFDPITRNITSCQFGWEYDRTDYAETIPSEFNWVCDRKQYATEIFSTGSLGGAFGTVLLAFAADRFGRKPIYFLSLFLCAFGKTLMVFTANDFFLFNITNIIADFSLWATFSMPTLVNAEISGAYYRAYSSTAIMMVWVIGNSLVPFLAMFLRHWYYLAVVAALPGYLLLLYYPFVDESPRWQISVGKVAEARKTIIKISKTNGTFDKLDWNEIDRMIGDLSTKSKVDAKDLKFNVLSMLSKFNLAKIFCLLAITRTVTSVLYQGISLNTLTMAGNKFVNYFLMSLVEGPGAILGGKLLDITGRRWTQTGFLGICALACLLSAAAVTYSNEAIYSLVGTLVIKIGVTVATLVSYLQGNEVLPTKLRSTGNGLCTLVSRVLGSAGPYIVFAGTYHISFPYLLLGLCCIIGSAASAFLPETYKQPLPETIEDTDQLGRGHKFWSYLPEIHEKTKAKQDQF